MSVNEPNEKPKKYDLLKKNVHEKGRSEKNFELKNL
jgi:hypothetical protein